MMRKLTGKKMTNSPKYTIIIFVIFFDFIARHGRRSLQMRTARRLVDIIRFMPLAGDLGFPSVFYRKVEPVLSIIFLYKKKNDEKKFFWNTRSFFAPVFSSKKKMIM